MTQEQSEIIECIPVLLDQTVSLVVSPNSMLCFVKFILSRLTNDDEKDDENSARLNEWREK